MSTLFWDLLSEKSLFLYVKIHFAGISIVEDIRNKDSVTFYGFMILLSPSDFSVLVSSIQYRPTFQLIITGLLLFSFKSAVPCSKKAWEVLGSIIEMSYGLNEVRLISWKSLFTAHRWNKISGIKIILGFLWLEESGSELKSTIQNAFAARHAKDHKKDFHSCVICKFIVHYRQLRCIITYDS